MTTEHALDDLLEALEQFRIAAFRGKHGPTVRRKTLAGFRLDLLRLRHRRIAMILSDGPRDGVGLLQALDAAITALRSEQVTQLICQSA